MKVSFEVEVREAEPGREPREPTLHGTLIQEGRAASGGRAEVFTPGSVEWPTEGVAIMTSHRGAVETRALPIRESDGRLTITARATEAIREAVKSGKKFMSVEFQAVEDRVTAGGVREVIKALVFGAALVVDPEYDVTMAEVRKRASRRRLWL